MVTLALKGWNRMSVLTKIMIPVILASLIPISTSLIAIQTYGLAQGEPAIYMQATPDSQNVPIGGSAEISVSATGQEGFEGKVRMSAEGAPAGVTVTFDPNPRCPRILRGSVENESNSRKRHPSRQRYANRNRNRHRRPESHRISDSHHKDRRRPSTRNQHKHN